MLNFSYRLISSWPPLAWIARCERGSSSVDVIHGAEIEWGQDWFCEATWDGPFSEGDFDRTDLVFGSGARRRDDAVVFVSAGSTVDRLQIAAREDCTFISNSLACLLETVGAEPSPTFRGYDDFFETITRGIEQAARDFPIADGTVQLIYHDNLRWDGQKLHVIPKPRPLRDFSSFENYFGFMREALKRIGENMSTDERAHSYSWLGTISRGYDSATCAALASEAGLDRILTHDQSRPDEPDDGMAVARALSLDCLLVNRLAWKNQSLLEPLFLAGDAQGKEIMIAGAGTELHRTVLLTGHGGDTAWSMNPHPAGENLARGAHSGLSMTEYRLHAGFIHLPLPFFGLRQLPDLIKLSQSAEMSPWNIRSGYDRPICRRILEEAGAPREIFGMAKTGASIRFLRGEDAWSRQGQHAFLDWLRKHIADYGLKRRSLLRAQLFMWSLELALSLQRKARFLRKHFQAVVRALAEKIKDAALHDFAFMWAMETVRKTYRQPCKHELPGDS